MRSCTVTRYNEGVMRYITSPVFKVPQRITHIYFIEDWIEKKSCRLLQINPSTH